MNGYAIFTAKNREFKDGTTLILTITDSSKQFNDTELSILQRTITLSGYSLVKTYTLKPLALLTVTVYNSTSGTNIGVENILITLSNDVVTTTGYTKALGVCQFRSSEAFQFILGTKLTATTSDQSNNLQVGTFTINSVGSYAEIMDIIIKSEFTLQLTVKDFFNASVIKEVIIKATINSVLME